MVLNLNRCLGSPGGVFEKRGNVRPRLRLPSAVRLVSQLLCLAEAIGELGIAAVGPGTTSSGFFGCFGHRLFKCREYNGMSVEYRKGKSGKASTSERDNGGKIPMPPEHDIR
jgi:hypothetical protein